MLWRNVWTYFTARCPILIGGIWVQSLPVGSKSNGWLVLNQSIHFSLDANLWWFIIGNRWELLVRALARFAKTSLVTAETIWTNIFHSPISMEIFFLEAFERLEENVVTPFSMRHSIDLGNFSRPCTGGGRCAISSHLSMSPSYFSSYSFFFIRHIAASGEENVSSLRDSVTLIPKPPFARFTLVGHSSG